MLSKSIIDYKTGNFLEYKHLIKRYKQKKRGEIFCQLTWTPGTSSRRQIKGEQHHIFPGT